MALELKKRPKKGAEEAKAPALANPDFIPAFPTVNVLPANVLEVVEIANLRKKLISAAVAVVLLIGGAWFAQTANIALANRDLKAEQAKTQGLNTEASGLAPVKAYYVGVETNAGVVRSNMAKEVLNSNIVAGIYQQAAKAQVALDAIALAVDTTPVVPGAPAVVAAAGACPGPDPFTAKPSIGCITLSGTGASRQSVAAFITALTDTTLFVNPYVSATTADPESGEVSFSATVGVVEAAYSKRFTPETFLKGVGK